MDNAKINVYTGIVVTRHLINAAGRQAADDQAAVFDADDEPKAMSMDELDEANFEIMAFAAHLHLEH